MSQQQLDFEEGYPITEFRSLFNEIEEILKEITDISITAEHNKRICNALKKRVCDANLATVFELKVQDQEFFNEQNYYCLQKLVSIIRQIKDFGAEISQMRTLSHSKIIEKIYKGLCREFENCLISLDLLDITSLVKLPDEESIVDPEEFIKVSF